MRRVCGRGRRRGRHGGPQRDPTGRASGGYCWRLEVVERDDRSTDDDDDDDDDDDSFSGRLDRAGQRILRDAKTGGGSSVTAGSSMTVEAVRMEEKGGEGALSGQKARRCRRDGDFARRSVGGEQRGFTQSHRVSFPCAGRDDGTHWAWKDGAWARGTRERGRRRTQRRSDAGWKRRNRGESSRRDGRRWRAMGMRCDWAGGVAASATTTREHTAPVPLVLCFLFFLWPFFASCSPA